jgi:hypothetical protein
MTEYVVLTKSNGGATVPGFANGGTTTVFNPSHIVRIDAKQDDKGKFHADLYDVSGNTFRVDLGSNLSESQLNIALHDLFRRPIVDFKTVQGSGKKPSPLS